MSKVDLWEPQSTAKLARSVDNVDGAPPHPFTVGVHERMTEEKTIADLEVLGTIPPALNGHYLRIGPTPFGFEREDDYHWFVGEGIVHGLELKDGKALWYRNRWVRSSAVSERLKETPIPGTRRHVDNANTNITRIGGRIFASSESGPWPVEFTRSDLEQQRYNPFGGTLKGAYTGHPHLDPASGETHAVVYDAGVLDEIRHVVVDADGKVTRELSIPVSDGPMVHDCAFTARYVLILDLSVTFMVEHGLTRFPFRWNDDHVTRVGLLPRAGTAEEIIWCPIEPCYAFHTLNAYDLPDGKVVLDIVAYDHMAIEVLDLSAAKLERWTIDPVARSVERRVIDGTPQEFPRMDERRLGKPYRYAYSIGVSDNGLAHHDSSTIFKHDLETGAREDHDFGDGMSPGEFVFVPATSDAEEDEGWLVGFVVNRVEDTTDLAIIDARHFASPPVACVRIPHRVPPGFHGNWLPAL